MNVLASVGGLGGAVAGLGCYVAAQIFGQWINIGETIFFIKTARGQSGEFGDIFAGGPYLLRALGAGILFVLGMLLICGVCLAPAGVLALVEAEEAAVIALIVGLPIGVIGGAIFSMTFFPYYYLIIDQNLGVIDSFSVARTVTVGNRLTAFALILCTSIICGLITLCTCGIGLLGVLPYIALLYPVIYLMMIGQPTAAQRFSQAAPAPASPDAVQWDQGDEP